MVFHCLQPYFSVKSIHIIGLVINHGKTALPDYAPIRIKLDGLLSSTAHWCLPIGHRQHKHDRDLLHDQMHVDLITGLKEQTHTGRPDWPQIFQAINIQYPAEKVNVFYCGPRGLSSTLRKQCNRYGFRYHKENF
jgi:hypothetical protein